MIRMALACQRDSYLQQVYFMLYEYELKFNVKIIHKTFPINQPVDQIHWSLFVLDGRKAANVLDQSAIYSKTKHYNGEDFTGLYNNTS